MASEGEASCEEDPNFAVIWAFFMKFGDLLGVTDIDICELQSMLENTHEVPKSLMDLHVKLLRKIKKSVHLERWEKSIIKFSHTFSSKDAWEIERFGYKNAKLTSKVRILKELLEAQFDLNTKFKTEINKLGSSELRSQPLGRDKFGHAYWFQSDENYQIRVFKEDLDDEKWTLVARDRASLVSLINTLSNGDTKISSDSALNEDSNSLSEKPIIDTGQQDTDSKETSDDEDFNLGRKNQDQDEDKPKPGLRIKNLSELMPSPKRLREEDNNGTIFQKYKIKNLEIRVSKIEREPIVGEPIEEPVMEIQGKGTGEENESPVVGETIEEDIIYVYGNGSGYDCQTGNKPEEDNNKSRSPPSSAYETKTTEKQKNIPESQTEDSMPNNDLNQFKDNSESPKKFFFGSGISPFKPNFLSSTMAFGSPIEDRSRDVKNNVANEKESSKSEKIVLDNKTVNINEPKASEVLANETATASKSNEMTELLEPKEILQGTKKETDNLDKSSKVSIYEEYNIESSDSLDRKESERIIMEPLCIKKNAYTCGEDKENKINTSTKGNEIANNMEAETVEKAETNNTNKTFKNNNATKIEESIATAHTVKSAETTRADEICNTFITAYSLKVSKTVKTVGNLKQTKINDNSQEKELKNIDEYNSVDFSGLDKNQGLDSNPDSIVTDTEKSEAKSDSDIYKPKTKANPGSNNEESEVQSEVVFVSGRTRGKKQLAETPAEVAKKIPQPIKKVTKGSAGIKKNKKEFLDSDDKAQTKTNSAESSIPNSPSLSIGDNSVISVEEIAAGDSCDVDVPEDDPLAVSDAEGDFKSGTATGATVSSFSLDFNDSPKQIKIPIVPSPMRAVRKRGREVTTLKTIEAVDGSGKRMKLKSRRQVDTALRKSVEQRIEQLYGSTSESKDSETEQDPKSKKKSVSLKKKPSKKGQRNNTSPLDSDSKSKKSLPKKRDPAKKNSRILAGLTLNEDSASDRPVLRQSRRLAQLKIKEQVESTAKSGFKVEAKKKKSKSCDKTDKSDKRKREKKTREEVSDTEIAIEVKKKKKREKPISRIFNENRPWQSSSEDSEEVAEEEEDEEEIIEEDYTPLGDLKSDHEFSPESDLEGENDEYQPMKRARTAKKELDEEEVDECPCQKCGKEDHPEWILLCDKCDSGWHCSCLRPPLLVIPEGDWFCPPCQHIILLEQFQAKLAEYDKKLSKKEVEDRRKERLAYVGISLNNVLPSKEHLEHRKKKRRHSVSGSNFSSSESDKSRSESETDSDEPIYQLRQRRQAKNYKFNEYDEMMKTAIGEDTNKPEDTAGNLGRGKDIQTIVKGLEPEHEAKKGEDLNRPSVINLKKMLRKKHRKLNSLEFDSEDEDISDEDFQGSSADSEDEDDEEPEETEESDDYMGRKRRINLPVRRSARARTRRYDTDFINDDSEDEPPKRKKKKSTWTDTEDSDASGYGPKQNRKKKKKKKRKDDSDDEPTIKKNRPRIKYGGLTSSEEEEVDKGRRTRGKKTTYVDTLGSDTEEERQTKKNPRRIDSDDEDFVANVEDEGDDEEKDSDEHEQQAGEVEEETDSEQERREKRSLLVPKIYIKKPLGAIKQRELEAAKVLVNAAKRVENDSTAIIKPEEHTLELKGMKTEGKESEPINCEIKSPSTKKLKPVEHISTIEINKNIEHKPSANYESSSKKDKTVESTIKKEVEEIDETMGQDTESKEPKSDLPMFESSVSLIKVPTKRGRKPKVAHEPIISNVTALFKNDDENDDLSEPPGISLPLFDDMASNSANCKELIDPETPKKRRARGPGKKKTLEESLSTIGTRIVPSKVSQPAIEIAAPPQPFSQSQPTPSVITRMLQSKPGITIYPVGRIRPKQFATMRDDDSDDPSPKNSPSSSPITVPSISGPPNQYNISGGSRGPPPIVTPYRPHGSTHTSMTHYSRGPSGFRDPPPPQGMLPHPYSHHSSHRPMDPSPSGGGPINLADSEPRASAGDSMVGPGRDSPILHGPPATRYPPISQISTGPILTAPRPQMQLLPQQPYSPTSTTSSNVPPLSQETSLSPRTSAITSTPQQSYPPRPTSNNSLSPSQQPYHPPTSNDGPPTIQQPYPPSTSSNGPPPQQPYAPRNVPPTSQETYSVPPTSDNGSSSQQPYPTTNNGPPIIQQSYPHRPSSSNGTPSSQPPEEYYRNYPPPTTEEPMPPATYQGMPSGARSPYSEQYNGENQTPVTLPSGGGDTKPYYDDGSGGEFAGLASYFSSQREDDLES